ncbi:MAG TPA: hypothetical protein VFR67_25320 [Pilimelia sp.]|nr:hypothetical protein [Pilimelia sp.]
MSVRAVERLLAGDPVPPEHRRLARLLSAAAGPARGHELIGGQALLDTYVRAGQDPTPTAVRPSRARLVTLSRALAMKVAAVLAALSVGSAALAAHTGNLPAGAQQTAHDLFSSWGVPAPGDADPPQGGTAPPGGDDRRPDPPAPGPGGPGTGPPGRPPPPRNPVPPGSRPVSQPPPANGTELRNLCNVYLRHRQYPASRPPTESELRTLAAAGGGEANIPEYCAQITGTAPARTGDAPPPERSTPPPGGSGEPTRPETRPTTPPPSASPPPRGR